MWRNLRQSSAISEQLLLLEIQDLKSKLNRLFYTSLI